MKKNQCEICGRPREGNPGDFYHEKECHRRDVLRRLEAATDPLEKRRLERELRRASYTGD